MGSSESSPDDYDEDADLPVPPMIQKVRRTLKITISNQMTSSFVNQQFSQQLKQNSGQVLRSANPFCPIFISKKQVLTSRTSKKQLEQEQQSNTSWLSCCLISPIMAIASPQSLIDNKGKYCVKAYIQGMTTKGEFVYVGIQNVQLIEDKAICLIVLERPIIQLGWAGVTCLQSQDMITNQSFKVINHPKFQVQQKSKMHIFYQQITKAFYRLEEQFVGSFKAMPGSLIVKVIDKKPYIVGIQVSEGEGHFITKEILQMLHEVAKKLIGRNKEMEFLRMIDIQELQFMEKL